MSRDAKRLADALKERSYKINLQKVRKWFKILNKLIFSGKLKEPEFVLKKDHEHWALFILYEDGTHGIEFRHEYPTKGFFINILAHEMVHLYQSQNGLRLTHGKTFFEWRDAFIKKGLELRIKY